MNKTSAAIVRSLLLGTSCLSAVAAVPALAHPTSAPAPVMPGNGTVVQGSGSISSKGNTTTIDQKTGKLVINWDSFSIGAGGTVQFVQPDAKSIALNRVIGADPSSIYGTLLANGQVWIINSNGMMFGNGAQVRVGGLIATTSDIRDADFMAGDYAFSGGTGAAVTNKGSIKAARGGSVVLSGASASNQGYIAADTGTVVIGGAKAFTVDFQGDGLLKYAITQPTGKADNGKTGASNSGTISAEGGRVIMTARAASSVQDAVVNNTGMISATSAKVGQNGEVILDAGDGDVNVAGTVDASGDGRGQTGGTVTVTGHAITVADNTRIDVSGDAGGGTVKIGGDLHGAGPTPQATNVTVGRAFIDADAEHSGNGGTVVVWSKGATNFAGRVSAEGGIHSGNGGMVETSGHTLHVANSAHVDTRAPRGKTGTWLLDPDTIVIQGGGGTSLSGGTDAVGDNPGGTDTIDPATIIAALGDTDVRLEATSEIEVLSAVDYSSTHSLSLLSEGGIDVGASIQNTLASGGGAINVIAGWDGTTTDFSAAALGDASFGANNGAINIGGNGAVAIGAASGATTVAGYDVRLLAESNDAAAQIGYRGAEGGGGAITVLADNSLSLFAGEGTASLAMVGNGDKLGSVAGAVTGDISIASGNVTSLQVYTGGTLWVGNASSGGETGNLTITGGVIDASCCGFEGQGSIDPMIAAALAGGDVLWTSDESIQIGSPIVYSSAHTLTLMASQDITVDGSIQNTQAFGGGAINLVAGWDGTTPSASVLATPNAYGNNDGTVAIGNESDGAVAVGAASGTTTVATSGLTIQSGASYAQLGFHGARGGAIDLLTTGDVLVSSAGGNGDAMIGNGSFLNDNQGSATGDIAMTVGGTLSLTAGEGPFHAWIGNSGGDSFGESGNVQIVAGALDAETDFGANVAADLSGGDFTLGVNDSEGVSIPGVSYDSAHELTLLATGTLQIGGSIQNDGSGAITLVGGWDGVTLGDAALKATPGAYGSPDGLVDIESFDGDVFVGSKSGTTTVLTGTLIVGADAGNVQLGYHGNGTGDIDVVATGNVLVGGGDPTENGPWAMIGNGALDGSVSGAVGGNITITAGGTLAVVTTSGEPPCDECDAPPPSDGVPTVGIGNAGAIGSGPVTGDVTLLAGDFDDFEDANGGFGRILAGDLANGDVIMGATGDCGCGLFIDEDVIYGSSHSLTLLSTSDITLDASIQNSGDGAINLVAGWDGETMGSAIATTPGAYGNAGGTVTVGGEDAFGDVAVGSAGGLTAVLTANLTLEADFGHAQLGFHGPGGGDIAVTATGDINVTGGDPFDDGYYAMIGNGALDNSVGGDVTGNITLNAGGIIQLSTISDDGECDCDEVTTVGIGNRTSEGQASGNLTMIAEDLDDSDDESAGLGASIALDLAGGNVTVGQRDAERPLTISNDLTYSSGNTLTLLAAGDIDIIANIQNAGSGAVTLVAGWDGSTLDPAHLGDAGVFGVGDGSIALTGGDRGSASVGSAGGDLHLYGSDLSVTGAGNFAQVGYHGAGGGNIFVDMAGDVTVTGGSGGGTDAQIGNGSFNGDTGGNVTGDITMHVAGATNFFDGTPGDVDDPSFGRGWLGNVASPGFTESGNVTVITAGGFLGSFLGNDLDGGDVFVGVTSEAGTTTLGGLDADSSHAFTWAAAGDLEVIGAVQNAGSGAITLVAGWDGQTIGAADQIKNAGAYGLDSHTVTLGGDDQFDNVAVGSASGTTTVLSANLTVAPATGFYAQLGYHGAGGGDIAVDLIGGLVIDGGDSAQHYAMIGNGSLNGDVVGNITGNIDIESGGGNSELFAGNGQVWIGNAAGPDSIETGSVKYVAYDFGSSDHLAQMLASDLAGGDVTLAITNTASADSVNAGVSYDSGHTLNLLTAGSLTLTGSVQNTGTGAINVVTGWDGQTFDPSHFGDTGVYGNHAGSLTIGGANAAGDSAFGSAGGATNVFVDALTVDGANGYAQLGVHGAATGAITIAALDEVLASGENGHSGQIGAGATFGSHAGAGNLSITADTIQTSGDGWLTGAAVTLLATGHGIGEAIDHPVQVDVGTLQATTPNAEAIVISAPNGGIALAGTGINTLTGAYFFVNGPLTQQAGAAIDAFTLSVTSTGGDITLTDPGNSFVDVTLSGTGVGTASVFDSASMSAGADIAGAALVLTATGNITGGPINAASLTATSMTGGVDLESANDVTGTVIIDAALGSAFTNEGAIDLGASNVGGNLFLRSEGAAPGGISQSGALTIAGGLQAVVVGSGDVVLTNAGNAIPGSIDAAALNGSVSLTNSLDILIDGDILAAGTVTLVSAGGISGEGAIFGAGLDMTAQDGAISLTNTENMFGTLHLASTGDAAIVDSTAVTVSGANVGGTLTLTVAGAIGQSGAIRAASLDVSAGSSAITLTDAGNSFGTLTVSTADDASITDSTALAVTGAEVGGTLTLSAGGALTQSGAIVATGLDVSTTAGAIALTDTGNSFATLTAATSGSDNAAITDSTGLAVASADVGGTLTLRSGGALTQSGAIVAGGLDVATVAGAITLTDAGNAFGALTVATTGPNDASIADSTGVSLGTANVGGALTLAAGGAIAQSGALTAASLDVSTTAGAITLTNAGNSFGALTVATVGSDGASFVDGQAILVAGASVGGTLSLHTTGSGAGIGQAGAIAAAGVAAVSDSGGVSLDDANNSFGTLAVSAANDATVVDATGVALGASHVGGQFSLTTGGAVTQSGAIQAASLAVDAGTGAVTLTDAGNAVGLFTVQTTGAFGAAFVNSGSVDIGASTVGGTLTLTSLAGGVSQSGALVAGGLDVAAPTASPAGGPADDIVLTDAGNAISGTASFHTPNDVQFHNTLATVIGASTVGGTLTLTAGGAITQGGAIAAAGLDVSTTGGAITLANAGNAFGTLQVTTAGTDNATITDSTALAVAGAEVGGMLTLTAGGAITQAGAITSAALDVTSTGDITLTDPANSFAALGVHAASGDASFFDNAPLSVSGADVGGTLSLVASDEITQTGAIVATELDASTTSSFGFGNVIDLEDAGNSFAVLNVSTLWGADVVDSTSVALDIGIGGAATISAGGAVTQSGAIQASGLSVTTSAGAILLNDTGNIVTGVVSFLAGDGGDIAFSDRQGFRVGQIETLGDVTLTSGFGIGLPNLSVNNASISAHDLTITAENGDIETGVDLTGAASLHASGAIDVVSFGALTLADSRAGTSFDVNGTSDITLSGSVQAGTTLTLESKNGGTITQTGGVITATGLVVMDNGNVALNSAGNSFAGLSATGTGDMSFVDDSGVALAAAVAGSLTVAAGGDVTQDGAPIVANAFDVSTTAGDITLPNGLNKFASLSVSAAVSATIADNFAQGVDITGAFVGGTLDLSAIGPVTQSAALTGGVYNITTTSGDITLTNAGNQFAGVGLYTPGDATVIDTGALGISGANVKGTLTASTTSVLFQRGAIIANALDVTSTGLDIELDDSANRFHTLTVSAATNAIVADGISVTIASASAPGLFELDGAGDVKQSGAIRTTDLEVVADNGSIILNNSDNVFGLLSVTTIPDSIGKATDASITDSTGFDFLSSDVVGTLTIRAGGRVREADAQTITAVGLDITTTSGAITLDQAGNAFGTLAVATAGSNDATVIDTTALSVTGADVGGTLTIRSAGDITQTGAIHAAALDLTATGGGAIALTDSGNSFATLNLTSAGDAVVADSTALAITAVTSGGGFVLQAGGAVTQTGAIKAASLDVATSTGAVSLTNAGNAFGALTVSTAGSDDATISDSSALSVTGASVGGTLHLTAGGALSQTGAIVAAALDAATTAGNITLTDAGNSFGILTLATAGNAAVTDSVSVLLGASSVGGTLTLTDTQDVGQTAAITAGSLAVTSLDGAIDLSNAANVLGTVALSSAGDASLSTSGGFTLAASNVGGALTLTATGAIAQSGALHSAGLDASTTAGGVQLANAGNAVSGPVTLNGSGDFAFTNTLATAIGAADVTGRLTLVSGQDITQAGAVQAADLVVASSGGNVVLTNAGNVFATLNVGSGGGATLIDSTALSVAGATVGGTLTLDAGGALTQSGAIVAAGLDVSAASGGITLTDAGNAFGMLTVATAGTDDATIADSTALAVAGATVGLPSDNSGGVLTLTAGGAVTQTGAITARDLIVTAATGDVILANAGNAFGELSLTAAGASTVSIVSQALRIDAIDAAMAAVTLGTTQDIVEAASGTIDAATLTATSSLGRVSLAGDNRITGTVVLDAALDAAIANTGDLHLGASSAGTTLTLTTTGGDITQSGALAAGRLVVDIAGSGDAVLTNAANAVSQAVTATTPGAFAFTNSLDLAVDGLAVGGTATLVSAKGISGQGIAAGRLDATAQDGDIVLTDSGNSIGALALNASGNAAVADSTGVTLLGATAGGGLTLTAGGAVTQSGAIRTASLDVSTTSGAITLTDGGNDFGTLTVHTAGTDNAAVADATALAVAGATVGGTLTLTAGGDVTQTGAIHAAGLAVTAQDGSIALTNSGNAFATLTLTTTAGGSDGLAQRRPEDSASGETSDATVTDSSGLTLAGADVAGTLTLAAAGAITQTGAIQAGALDVSTTQGAITLTNGGNAFGPLTVAMQDGAGASFFDLRDLVVAGATLPGTLTLASGGDINQTGAIHAAVLNATGGAITLNSAGNSFATLGIGASGDAAVTDSTGLTVSAADVGGLLTLTAGGAVGQSGAIEAGTLDVRATGGAIALTNAANRFAGLSLATTGSDGATVVDSTGVVIAQADVGGALVLTAGGNIGQTHAINAASLDVTATGGAIALNAADNVFATLDVSTTGTDFATVADSTALSLASATVGGRLTLSAGGTITQTGGLHSAGLTVSTSSGDIVLTDLANSASGTVQLAAPGAVSFANTLTTVLTGLSAGGDVTLLSKGTIDVFAPIQAQTGDVTLLAGWDGSTIAAAHFGDAGVYGNANGNVVIGGAGADGDVFVGSAGGATAIYADNVLLTGTNGIAQIGFHGAGGGSIGVTALGSLGLTGGAGDAMVGNGSLGSDVEGAATGDIDLRIAGFVSLTDGSESKAWIGNASQGGESGNLTVVTTDLAPPPVGRFGEIVDAAIMGGDVTFAFTGTIALNDQGNGGSYDSSHALTILSGGDLAFGQSVQNAGTGAINLVAGWDGHTLDAADFGNAGVFGNGGHGIAIGGTGAVAVGSAGGTTALYGASLTLDASNGAAQLGFNGHGNGAIVVDTTGDVTLTGGGAAGDFAQIGNGGLKTAGDNHGDILITAGGDVVLTGGAGSEAYSQIGHGGAESNTGATGYENVAAIVIAADNVTLGAGGGSAAYAMIGNGGYKSGLDLAGIGTNGGDITIAAAHAVTLTGNGADAFAQIGNGGSQSNLDPSAAASGSDSGLVTVAGGNGAGDGVTLTAGAGANAYAQIGNGGYSINAGANAVAANFTVSGNVTVSDLALVGGGPNGYAQIGNGDASKTSFGNISGDVTIDADGNITYTNGAGPNAFATIGNFTGHGTVTGHVFGATPPDNSGGDKGGGNVTTDPGTIGVIVTTTAGNTPQNNPPITVINTVVIPPPPEDNGATTLTVHLEDATPPGPLALLDDKNAGSEPPSTADSATVVIADSLDGTHKLAGSQTILAGMLKQSGAGNNAVHAIPPADQDFSSWGNEALWQ